MVDTALRKNGSSGGGGAPAGRALFTPRADVFEAPEELRLVLDLPGVRPDGVDLQFERGELAVRGTVAPAEPPGKLLAAEYEVGDYYRAFIIGHEVDADGISAELKNGVLTVHLPRSAAARARRISVQGQ
jgi:HSP20 family protein